MIANLLLIIVSEKRKLTNQFFARVPTSFTGSRKFLESYIIVHETGAMTLELLNLCVSSHLTLASNANLNLHPAQVVLPPPC